MKNQIALLAVVLFLFSATLVAQDTTKTPKEFRKITQNSFTTGEKLTYEINYGFVTAGTAVLEVLPDYQIINGRKCYDIVGSVGSSSSFEWVYKFTEKMRSFVDVEGLFPWRFEQTIREPNYSKDYEIIFDQENLKAKISQTVKGEKKPDEESNIQQYVNDIISAFYFSRTFNFASAKEGDLFYIPYFHNKTIVSLPVKYLGKEKIEVPAGEFNCIMVQPNVKEGDIASKAEDLVIWLTDDAVRMPVKVQVSIIIGSLKIELTKYQGTLPVTSKVK